ncbi:manganese superoxide dismutase [Mycena pura]|uniref:Manganese superoxide dismutase n=1 Tax=Mycena pura TaxID=153505 RepID=A0AAD7E5R7_9AGAR|nr:manganese superoxide dismutase [Mycena pura]
MNFVWRSRYSLLRARRSLIPRGTRGVTGQFDHLPLPLPYDIKDGLGNFLPPPALEAVAVEYQLGLLARLTDEVRHTDEEGSSVTQVVISCASSREKTLAFNYASLALNNSFFLGNLTSNPADAQEDAISSVLTSQIHTDHGGLEQFKSTFSASAMGMFTSGCVWFVTDKNGSTSILPTFGPGTLLVRSRMNMAEKHPTLFHELSVSPLSWDRGKQYVDKYLSKWGEDGRGTVPPVLDPKRLTKILSTEPPPPPPIGRAAGSPVQPRFLHTSARQSDAVDFSAQPSNIYDEQPTHPPNTKVDALHAGEVLFPLFCVSVQEHAWITAGYGVWGKEAWLREFWNVLDWRRVSEAYGRIRAPPENLRKK